MELKFTKMQAAGNDYIYHRLPQLRGCRPTPPRWAVQLSRRHFSVGADGVIYLCPPLRADGDAAMRMFNADGSEGVDVRQRCALRGGIFIHPRRAAGLYPYRHALTPGSAALHRVGRRAVAGRDGPLYGSTGRCGGHRWGWAADRCWMCRSAQAGAAWRVLLCQPWATRTAYVFTHDAAARRGGAGRLGPCAGAPPGVPAAASMWNLPSTISPTGLAVDGVGARQRGHAGLRDRVPAPCAAAAVLTGRCPRGETPILVQLPGGTLEVCVQRDDTVLLTGDAAATFSGTVLIQPCKAPRGVV